MAAGTCVGVATTEVGLGVDVAAGALVAPGQLQLVALVQAGLRQKPAKQVNPELQFAFDPQVPPQALVAPDPAVGTAVGFGVLVG